MIATIASCVIVLIILLHWSIRGGRRGKLVELLPGPTPLPIIGNLLLFPSAHDEIFDVMRKLNKEFYPLYRLWSVTVPIVNVLHPDDAEIVLSSMKFIEKSYLYDLIKPWLNTGLLTSTGTKWQTRRKILTPTFHFTVLQQFTTIFVHEGIEMVETLKTEKGPVVKDIMQFVSVYTLNSICETAMGVSLKDKGDLQLKYRKAVGEFCHLVPYRLFRPWFARDNIVFTMSTVGNKQSKTLKVLHGFSTKIINERKQYHEETQGRMLKNINTIEQRNEIDDDDGIMKARRKKMAMLDVLIAAYRNNEIDDNGIREEVDTFTFEGHDTTAMAAGYSLLLFAKHKDIQERIRQEVNAVMLECNEELTMQALQKLTYLERCIKEVLRLYPSVPMISRNIREDLQLKNGLVPAGTVCHVHIYDIHRNPHFWKDPETFDPDRFLPEKSQRHPFSYVPFSAGPRNCIGQRFAMLELKAIIASVIHNFYLEPVDELNDVKIMVDLVLRPSSPIRLKFVPINSD